MQVALRNMRSTSLELSKALAAVLAVVIYRRTVRRRLNEGGFDIRRPTIEPLLIRERRVTRLCFARERVNWTIDDWK